MRKYERLLNLWKLLFANVPHVLFIKAFNWIWFPQAKNTQVNKMFSKKGCSLAIGAVNFVLYIFIWLEIREELSSSLLDTSIKKSC